MKLRFPHSVWCWLPASSVTPACPSGCIGLGCSFPGSCSQPPFLSEPPDWKITPTQAFIPIPPSCCSWNKSLPNEPCSQLLPCLLTVYLMVGKPGRDRWSVFPASGFRVHAPQYTAGTPQLSYTVQLVLQTQQLMGATPSR